MDTVRDPEPERILRSAIKNGGCEALLAWFPEDIVMTCAAWAYNPAGSGRFPDSPRGKCIHLSRPEKNQP